MIKVMYPQNLPEENVDQVVQPENHLATVLLLWYLQMFLLDSEVACYLYPLDFN